MHRSLKIARKIAGKSSKIGRYISRNSSYFYKSGKGLYGEVYRDIKKTKHIGKPKSIGVYVPYNQQLIPRRRGIF